MDTPVSITETKETYIREDGTTFTRSDIYVKLAVTFRDKMLKTLKGPKLSVFLCIALHCNGSMEAWPSLSTIEKETGYSKQAVVDAIHALEAMNLIERTHRTSENGDNTSNLYRIQGFFSMGGSQPGRPGVVNLVDQGLSTTLTRVVNQVDTKNIPCKKNQVEEKRAGLPASPPPVQPVLLEKDPEQSTDFNSKEDLLLKERLQQHARENGRRGARKFANFAQKQRFRDAVITILKAGGQAALNEALDYAFTRDFVSRARVIDTLVKWAANMDKPRPGATRKPPQARVMSHEQYREWAATQSN